MDEETKKRFDALEEKITKLDDKVNFYWEQTKGNFKIADEYMTKEANLSKRFGQLQLERFERIEKWIGSIGEGLEIIKRLSMRYDEAYYRVFPERLDQDARVTAQLRGVLLKPAPDDESKPK